MKNRTFLFSFILLTSGLFLFGCALFGAKPKQLQTVTLIPVEFTTKSDGDDGDAGLPCCQGLQGWGLSCKVPSLTPDPISVSAGYSNSYESGTSPCACWHWHDCIWRGYIKFDLSALPGTDVVSASLKWSSTAKLNYPGTATNESWCETTLYVAEQAWGPYKMQGDQVGSPYITSPTTLQVGGIVRDWFRGVRENHGFFFVGSNEKMAEKSNQKCYMQIHGITLEVTTSK